MNETIVLRPPSPWVTRFAELIAPGGDVLDLACGSGRHSRYLSAHGYRVEAVDKDAAALAGLAAVPGVAVRQADLEAGSWPYFGRCFDGIVVTHYLCRPLLPLLVAALAENGVLIYETFMVGQERYGRPSNPAHLLRPNELLEIVRRRLSVVAFEQGCIDGPEPRVIQRLCASRQSLARLPRSGGTASEPDYSTSVWP